MKKYSNGPTKYKSPIYLLKNQQYLRESNAQLIFIVSTPVVYYTLLINILLLYIKRPSKLLMDKKRKETMKITSMNGLDNYTVESKKTIAKSKETCISIEIS